MEQFTMDTEISISDLLTLVAIAISTFFGIRAMMDVARTERKSNTQRMLDRWSSDSFVKHKAVAVALLRERGRSQNEPIFVGDLMDQMPRREEYFAISEMNHFFSDLNSLWRERALDDRLTCALFGRPIEFWWQWFRRIDGRLDPDDNSPSHDDVNTWRETYVLPLYPYFKEVQRRTGMATRNDE